MKPQTIIAKKRDGEILTREEIGEFILGVTEGTWADYQISAMIMAMFLNELNSEEQAAITHAMLHSGEILDFSSINKSKADKHSTGGVGDKTSLIIAPLVASCGIAVPMISGRGLGHTGGTLDKLESIRGFNVGLTTDEFKQIVDQCGYAMAGQTAEIAPADRKIYALRDATATVPTIPLIVASIMSKKLAEGLDSLVLDVKTGSGAFMERFEDSKRLALALVDTGNAFGVKTEALITDMGEPLGEFVGNSLEVYECVKILRNEAGPQSERLVDLSLELAGRMLMMSGVESDSASARRLLESKIEDGSALEKFRENTRLQGGDASICDKPDSLIESGLLRRAVTVDKEGFIASIDTKGVGFAVCDLGGGRVKAEDEIDFAVGFSCAVGRGTRVGKDDPLGDIYCRTEEQFEIAAKAIQNAYVVAEEVSVDNKIVREIVK